MGINIRPDDPYQKAAMAHHLKPSFKFVRRPDGTLLTPGSLPPANLKRWVMRHKADVVMAVGGGIITMEAACARYRLTREEFLSWKTAFEHFGTRGLSTSGVRHMQEMRRADKFLQKKLAAPAGDQQSRALKQQERYGRPKLAHTR